MLLRVILAPDNIRKVSCPDNVSTLEDLKSILCEKLNIESGFTIQFEDPDFNNELCNLTNISELPADKATLKIFWNILVTPIEENTLSDFTVDTASVSSDSSLSLQTFNRVEPWPKEFPIPKFSLELELRLQKANELYEQKKIPLDVTRDIKMEILCKVSEVMFSYKAYPNESECEKVAAALIVKHPCLTEATGAGWLGWKVSIQYKMNNLRQKLRYAGCAEVQVNAYKRGFGSPRGCLKKPRKSEVNFLPNHPGSQKDEDLETERQQLEDEVKKKNMNLDLINTKMDLTFSLRRKEIVMDEPLVSVVQQRWPGLFIEQQTMDVTTHKRATVLQGLPLYLREYKKLSTTCHDTDSLQIYTNEMKIGILEVVRHHETHPGAAAMNVAVVIEGRVVIEELADFTTAFVILVGLLYALNIQYPKEVKYTFETVQKVFLNIGDSYSHRVLSLKNMLYKC
ncbi:uncharacterized protein LOC127526999 [Erpetoichthys calabaricus]|uniref:uncharacterized protein LOC127526999 n=1 Tax=Erpetoichthys calabaricus TaxID=27687 RepID=UPI002234AD40|nr:uncharacterized protein LOC127526999 [Erpetoichthys calabaricus]